MSVIEIKNIRKTFGEKVIFDNLSFTIEQGTMVAIIGESGKGKTTLLNCLGQLDELDGGVIEFMGKSISLRKRRDFFKKDASFLFQNFALIDNETVWQNLALVCKDRKRADEELIKVGLLDHLDKKVYELSGGEQQRVALVRVTLKDAPFIFADEPTASLDEHHSQLVMESLKTFREQGKTIIVVTHNLQLLSYFDQIIDLNNLASASAL